MRTKRTKIYIEETADEHGVKQNQVKEIADSMFEFAAEVMGEGERESLNFPEIRLMKWGIFKVKEGRRKHFERINNKNGV